MKQQLKETLILVAEITGAVAIVLTLGFLTLETRRNTNAVQAQTYQILMQELNDYRALLMDPRRYRLEEKFREKGWQSLTSAEHQFLRVPILINWGIYESAYFANERGVLGESEWERFSAAICRRFVAHADYWDPGGVTPMTELLTSRFVDYIESSCLGN